MIEPKQMFDFTPPINDSKLSYPFISYLFFNDIDFNKVLFSIDSFLLLPDLPFTHSIAILLALFRNLSDWRMYFFFAFEFAKLRLFVYRSL